jgi:hypothetical protein
MGKFLNISIVIWALVLAICILSVVYWIDVVDDIINEPFSRPPGDMSLTPEEIDDLNEADRQRASWGTRTFVWAYFGFQFLLVVWALEEQDNIAIGTSAPGL